MFDIGFLELLVIAIIGLLVMGPERLPGAIRTGALWLGRLRRSFAQIKSEVEREINADEIRQQLHNEAILQELADAKKALEAHTQDVDDSINEIHQHRHDSDALVEPTEKTTQPTKND